MTNYDNTNPFDDPDVKDAGHVDIDLSGDLEDGYTAHNSGVLPPPPVPRSAATSGPSGSGGGPPPFNSGLNREALQARDDEITRRERAYEENYGKFKQTQAALGMNVKIPNWPCQCYALTYHNIKAEIPHVHQGVIRHLYLLYLGSVVAFFWNGLAMLIAASVIDSISFVAFLLACLYFGCGVVGAWKGWYRLAYKGAIGGSSRKWLMSFGLLGIHIAFCILMTIGPPDIGAGGLIVMFDSISESSGTAICLVVSSALWGLVSAAGVILLKRTHAHYRKEGGKSAQQAGTEIVQAEARRQARKEAERQVREGKDGITSSI